MKLDKQWRKLSATEYAELYPAKPKAIRKIAYGLRQLGAGNEVFTMAEWELAEACGVSKRTLQRYIGLFESYGILEVKRWRYRANGGSPSSYRVFLGNVIPEGFTRGGGDYPISAVERRKKGS
jgi:response regulator of citrate/malate metabolism